MSVRYNAEMQKFVAYDDETGEQLGAFETEDEARAAASAPVYQAQKEQQPEQPADVSAYGAGVASVASDEAAVIGRTDAPQPENPAPDVSGILPRVSVDEDYQGTGYHKFVARSEAGRFIGAFDSREEAEEASRQATWAEQNPGGQGEQGPPRSVDTSQVVNSPIATAVADRVEDNDADRAAAVGENTANVRAAQRAFEDADELSLEARGQQQEGLAMNRELYDLLLNFDPEAYAQQQSSEATARALSIARGAGGGAGARQFALQQAIESAPAAQAEAAQAAQSLEAQRRGQALKASEQYGSLITATRGQDQARAEALGTLGLEVASAIFGAQAFDMQLDSAETEMLGNVYLALERLNQGWAGLDEQEREARAREALAQQGLEQQWDMFLKSRELTAKDVLGGIFGLFGSGLEAGGRIVAARQ